MCRSIFKRISCVCVCVHIYTHTHIYIYIYIYTHTHIYACIHSQASHYECKPYAQWWILPLVVMCKSIFKGISCIYIYIYIHIHIYACIHSALLHSHSCVFHVYSSLLTTMYDTHTGADECVLINTAQEFDGSDGGARLDESVSWGKIRYGARPVKVSHTHAHTRLGHYLDTARAQSRWVYACTYTHKRTALFRYSACTVKVTAPTCERIFSMY